jgi:hypothetical protein
LKGKSEVSIIIIEYKREEIYFNSDQISCKEVSIKHEELWIMRYESEIPDCIYGNNQKVMVWDSLNKVYFIALGSCLYLVISVSAINESLMCIYLFYELINAFILMLQFIGLRYKSQKKLEFKEDLPNEKL